MYIFDYDSNNEDASVHGKRYWGVILPDGRYMYFHADRVIADAGSLVALREVQSENESDGEIQTTLALAHGQWSAYFAANVVTGEPICVDRTSKVRG